MRASERMKKVFSLLLALIMVMQYVPTTAFAATTAEDGLCEHHPVHTPECHYAEAVEGQPCTHAHDELCGYIEAVAEVKCACEATDENGALVHTEGCGYVAPVEGSDCAHVHDEACGYVAAVEAHECHYECAECEDSNVIANQSADWCGNPLCSQEDAFHVTSCTQYVAPENPKCYCVEKCAEPNIWCDVCGFDYTACTGTDRSAGYGTGWEIEETTLIVTGHLTALPEGVEYSRIEVHEGGNLDLGEATVTCNVGNYYGTISSGTFNTTDLVSNYSIISGGTFHADVNNEYGATISGGTFTREVRNDGTISGGDFISWVINKGTITGGTIWYGTVSNEESGTICNAKFEMGAHLESDSTPPQSVIHSVNGEDVALTYNAALPAALGEAEAWYQDLTQVTDGTVPLNYTTYVGEYKISTAAATNGTVSVPATAKYGQTVTVTATASEGYVLDTVTVQQGETAVTVTDNAFTMPAGDVNVSAAFKLCEHDGSTHATATNNGDGTHSFECSVCGETGSEAHNYKSGTSAGICVCGAACPHSNFDSDTGNCKDCETSLAIAKIETGGTTTYYQTADELRTAVKVNGDDQTLTLLADLAIKDTFHFMANETKNTLDLNGHTLICSDPISERILLEYCELTITGTGSINIFMAADSEGSKIVVGSGVTLNNTLRSAFGGVLDLTNATIPEAGLNVILYSDDSDPTTYNVSDVLLLPADYYFFVDGKAAYTYSGETEGTVLKHTDHSYTYTDNGDTHTLSCSGCDFSKTEPHAMDAATGKCACGLEMAVASATIGGVTTHYKILHEAIQAVSTATAADNAQVKLLKSIDMGDAEQYVSSGEFTLDLNGQTLSSNNPNSALRILNATVTITDNLGGGEIKGKTYGVDTRYSTLTIINATITATGEGCIGLSANNCTAVTIKGATISGASQGVNVTDCTVLTITDAAITATGKYGYGMNATNCNVLTITDTVITAAGESGDSVNASACAEVTIEGGTFSGGFLGVRVNGGNLTITDAEITGDGEYGYGVEIHECAEVAIEGGTIRANGANGIGVTLYKCTNATMKGTDITANGTEGRGVQSETCTLTIQDSAVTGDNIGVNAYGGSSVSLENSTVTGAEAVYSSGSEIRISGGSVNGSVYDLVGTVKLILPASGTGTTFPGGIIAKTSMESFLSEGAAYWHGSRMIDLEYGQREYTLGDVTVKAACDHSGNTNETVTDNGDGTHGRTCSVCSCAITEAHTMPLAYVNLEAEGHKAFYPCCQKAEDVEVSDHEYEGGYCACEDEQAFTLSFYANWGDEIPVATFSVPYGTVLTMWESDEDDNETFLGATAYLENLISQITTVPQSEHYTFSGWDLENGPIDMFGDESIYGRWTPVSYKVTWDLAGGYAEYPDELFTEMRYNEGLVLFTDLHKEGYTFSHFVDQNGLEFTREWRSDHWSLDPLMPGYDLTLTAVWDVNAYVLHAQDQSLNVDYGTALTGALSGITPEKTGHTLTGWKFYLDEGCTEEYTGTTMPACDLYAQPVFTPIEYNITWILNGCTVNLVYGKELPGTLPYTGSTDAHQLKVVLDDPAGYTLAGFKDGNGNKLNYSLANGYLFLPVTGDMTVEAIVTPKAYTATWETGDGGSYEKEFKYGETITIPDSEIFRETFRKAGYTVAGWEGYTEGMTMPIGGVAFTAKWQINPASLPVSSAPYTGQPHTPTVTVEGLTEGEDFTVEYPEDMTNAGEKTIIVRGLLGGETTVTYTIEKQQIAVPAMRWTVPQNAVYNGTEFTAALNGTLPTGVVATLSGDKATNAGSYTAKARFSLAEGYSADNYEIVNGGDLTADWTIAKKDIAGATITLGAALTYNGEQQTQTVASVKIDGLTVTYTVSGNTGTDAKGYTLTVTGNGNFEGTETKEWSIAKQNISGATITLGDSLTYNGSAQTQEVIAVKIGDLTVTYDVTDNEQLGAGNYTLIVTGNGNFEGSATADWSIAKAKLTITANNNSITYGDIPAANGVTGTGFVSSESMENLSGELTYSYSYEQFGNVGTYKITPSGVTSNNYEITFADGILTVNAKAITVKADDLSKTYGEADPKLTYKVEGLVNGDQLTGELKRAAGENVGSYAIEQNTLTAGDNYTITYTGAKLTINAKAIMDSDVKLDGSLTYTGSEQTQPITVTEGITYEVSGNKATDVGTYELTVKGTGNYTGEVKLNWSIKEAAAVISAAPTAKELTYTGEAQALLNAGATDDGKLVYSLTENGAYTEDIPTGTNAGEYTVWYYVVGDDNHFDSPKASVKVTIAKAQAVITVDTTPITVTYGETVTLPAATTNFGTVTCSEVAADIKNAGTYIVTYAVADSANYIGGTKTLTVTVNAKAITVTADALSKTYGEADPKLTYTAQGLVNGDELTGELKRVAGENVGSYAIEQNTLTAGDNYSITYTGAELTINPKSIADSDVELDGSLTYTGSEQTQPITVTEGITYEVSGNKATEAGDYTLTVTASGNYTGSVTKQWSIGKAEPQILWNSGYSNTYGSNMYITAYINGVDGKLLPGTAVAAVYDAEGNERNAVTCTKTDSTGTYFYNWLNKLPDDTYLTVGSYVVKLTYQGDENYNDKTVELVTYTISKADPVIGTVGCDMALFNSTAVSDVVLTRTDDSIPGTLVLTDTDLTAGVGTYNWKFTPADTDNYNTITGTVELTVTADVLEAITASGTLEKDSYSHGDTFSIDGLTITATYASGATKDVTALVEYNKTLSAGQTSMELTYGGKTCTITGFTVAKKQLVIDGVAWNVPENAVYSGTAYTATLTGDLPEGVTVTKTGDTATNAGDYTAKAVFSLAEGYSADNYEIVNGGDLTADWTIAKKNIAGAQITLGAALTYNGQQQTQEVTKVEVDGLTVTYTASGNVGIEAKFYTLQITGTGNFEGIAVVTWRIARAELTITADSKVIYVGEELPALTYTVTGLAGDDALIREPALTTDANTDLAGSYTITAANADAGDNYTITYVSGSLKVLDKETEVETRIELTELTEVPDGLKDTLFNTVEKIKEELIRRILAISTGYSPENTAHYDVTLHFSLDGGESWIMATKETFPTEGITVVLPYPEGTNPRDYDFMVSHMFTVTSQRLGTVAGEVEIPAVEETADGIRVTLNGLSPVTVAARYHDHTGGTATCTDQAICDICGNAYGELDAANHAGGTEVKNAREATCGAEGYTGDTCCKGCGEIMEKGTVIKATGEHTYGDWKVVEEPTKTAKGEKQRTCSVCGHVDSEEIPMITDIPATGDDSNILLYGSMFTVSLAGLAVLLLAAKKRKQKKA